MTFQLAFRAANGVLLASDLKHTSLYGFTTHAMGPKIKVAKNGIMACCSAGDTDFCFFLEDEVNRAIAENSNRFFGNLSAVRQTLSDCLQIAQQQDTAYRLQHRIPETRGGSTLFVFRNATAIDLWSVNTTGRRPEIQTVFAGDYVKAGYANSPAVFFPSRYFEKLPNTVDDLIPLAVHTVLMAESDHVKGIEIGIFTQDSFKVLDAKELQPFIDRSNKVDALTFDGFRKGGNIQ